MSTNQPFKVGDLVRTTTYARGGQWIAPGTAGKVIEIAKTDATGMDETLYIVKIGRHRIAYAADEIEHVEAAD